MGSDALALARLKKLLQFILLRRTTGVLELPTRTDLRVTLRFSDEERVHYHTVERSVIDNIDTALNHCNTTQSTCINVLQQINELRLICDQGTHRTPKKATAAESRSWNSQTAQAAFEALIAASSLLCFNCGVNLTTAEDAVGLTLPLLNCLSSPQMFSCLRIACAHCIERNSYLSCGHLNPLCAKASVALTPGVFVSTASSPSSSNTGSECKALPTKVNALVEDLKAIDGPQKRYVHSGISSSRR